MDNLLPIIQQFIVSLSSFWTWFIQPLNFGSLNNLIPALFRTPATLLSFGGLVAIIVINIIAKVLSAVPVAQKGKKYMADLLDLIYEMFYDEFVIPLQNFLLDWTSLSSDTSIVLTMPGSNTPLISTDLFGIISLCFGIFLFIGSIICFIGVIKFLYKIGKSLFGGRR